MANDHTIVHYARAACGGGKTHAFIELTAEKHKRPSNCRNTLYVGMSKELLAQVERNLKQLGVTPVRIDSDTHQGHVIPAIREWLLCRNHDNDVLLITHAAYLSLPYFHNRESWDIFMDEVPQCDVFYDPRLPRGWELIQEHSDINWEVSKSLGLLVPRNDGKLRHWLDEARDDGEETARKILADVANPSKLMFVHLASWERMTELRKVSKTSDDANRIRFLAMLSPQAFEGVTVMGADVQKSLLWHWFEMLGVKWRENTDITSRLRYRDYSKDLGQRVHVHYLYGEGQWSKKKRNEAGDAVEVRARQWVGDERFLLVKNNDFETTLAKLPGCQVMSSVCHGLNCYQDYTRLVFLSALNRKNAHRGMLNDLGISDEVQRQSIGYSALHQITMRSAARNPESKAHVRVLVPDRFMADDVADALGGAFIGDADGKLQERFRVSTSCKGNAKNEDDIGSILPGFGVALSTKKKPQRARGPLPEFDDDPDPRVVVTWNELRPRSDDPNKFYDTQFKSEPMRVLKLVGYLERMHKRRRSDKTGDKLFQLTRFDEDVPMRAGWLNTRNFMFSYGLLLDFDGGSVTPEEFIRIFWTEAGSRTKIAFIICNTFSSRPGMVKFRVIIPFRECTHSIAQFKAVVDSVIKRLEENGHPLKTSGLDPKSRNVVQRYYLPCTNAACPEAALFRVHGLRRVDEFLRYAINPNNFIPTPRKEWTRRMTSPERGSVRNTERILEEADTLKREIEDMPEGRRELVFALACKLAAFWSLSEVYEDLMNWAPDANVERHVEGALEYLETVDWTEAA